MQVLIQNIKESLQPKGRALAIASTFELFMSVTGIDESNLKEALAFLAVPDSKNEPRHVTYRRTTCKEVAQLIPSDQPRGYVSIVEAAWSKWVEYLKDQVSTTSGYEKVRFTAMLETAERELFELTRF